LLLFEGVVVAAHRTPRDMDCVPMWPPFRAEPSRRFSKVNLPVPLNIHMQQCWALKFNRVVLSCADPLGRPGPGSPAMSTTAAHGQWMDRARRRSPHALRENVPFRPASKDHERISCPPAVV